MLLANSLDCNDTAGDNDGINKKRVLRICSFMLARKMMLMVALILTITASSLVSLQRSSTMRFQNKDIENVLTKKKSARCAHNDDIPFAHLLFHEKELFVSSSTSGCIIPHLQSPAKHLAGRWVISSGGSNHMIATMALFHELAAPYGAEYRYPNPLELEVDTNIIEIVVGVHNHNNNTVRIRRFDQHSSYIVEEQDDTVFRFTFSHDDFFHNTEDFLLYIRNQTHNHHPLDLVLDANGFWYSFCIDMPDKWYEKHCEFLNWKKKDRKFRKGDYREKAEQYASKLVETISTMNITTARFYTFDPWSYTKVPIINGFLENLQDPLKHTHISVNKRKESEKDFPYHDSHPSAAVGLGQAYVWLHPLFNKRDESESSLGMQSSELCTSMDGLGCNSIDAYEKGYYKNTSNLFDTCRYGCSTSPCQRSESSVLDIVEAKEAAEYPLSGTSSQSTLLVPGGNHRLVALGTTNGVRWIWSLASLLSIIYFIYQECMRKPPTAAYSMLGMGSVRIFASLHVVAGHLQRYGKDTMTPIPLAEFGYTWVPWFMMLSGFVLSWSALKKPKNTDIPWYSFLQRRLLGIYPVYISGLLCTITISKAFSKINLSRYVIDILLLQSWYPTWTENAIMPHTWFLSAIWPLWAMHGRLFHVASSQSTMMLLLLCGLMFAIPTIAFGLLPLASASLQCWWCGHVQGRCEIFMDYLVIVLKFHPIFYAPTYIAGMSAAIVAHRCQEDNPAPRKGLTGRVLDFSTALGVSGLVMSFAVARATRYAGAKLAFRLGALLPFHALILMGLAIGSIQDPIRQAFELRWFSCLGNVSYSQYAFQFVWFHLWRSRIGLGFWMWCLGASILVARLVDQPCRRREWKQGACGIVAMTLFVGTILRVTHFEVGRDIPMNLWSGSDTSRQRWINPSVVWDKEGNLVVAARRHEVRKTKEANIWYSDIGLGVLDSNTFQPLRNSTMQIIRSATDMTNPCVSKVLEGNQTLIYVVGQEDPRLFLSEQNKAVYLTTVTYEAHGKECWARQTIGMAKKKASDVVMLDHGTDGPSKNWMRLTDNLFMVNVTNQAVVNIDNKTGATIPAITSQTANRFKGDRKSLSLLKRLHGGSNFVPFNSVVDGEPVWLAVVHTAKTYENYLIELEKTEPFSIRRISGRLQLTVLQSPRNHSTVGGAFASGLEVLSGDGLIVTYGSSDFEARAFVLNRHGVSALFSPVEGVVSIKL